MWINNGDTARYVNVSKLLPTEDHTDYHNMVKEIEHYNATMDNLVVNLNDLRFARVKKPESSHSYVCEIDIMSLQKCRTQESFFEVMQKIVYLATVKVT